ncbi:Queuosine Biosynthesis QueE Radical SAM [hydrothermal vent metagenome]|uniref:Queuosine Biosynthesis QueE Radical SAM n=1 Tax=hydrothermal vent metagenome TaxID=652676 RepID=A0A1W1BHT0_9ZZZZ
MIYLVEHFYSIQGEGRYTGRPSLFFRFGGCNLKCEGFGCKEISPKGKEIIGCDTVYAVDRSFAKEWIEVKDVTSLIAILNYYELPFAVDVVFTGGEPLIYANDAIFVEFLEYLHLKGHRITFETNATMMVDFERYPVYRECIFALSVKLSNSGEPYERRVRSEVISTIANYAKESFFKFSIDQDSINAALDTEIEEICSYAPSLELYCMPVGGDKSSIEANTLPLIEYCKERGYTFSDRLHIRIWDANKGV